MKIEVVFGEFDHLEDIKQPEKRNPFLVIKNRSKWNHFGKQYMNIDKSKKHISNNDMACVQYSCPR